MKNVHLKSSSQNNFKTYMHYFKIFTKTLPSDVDFLLFFNFADSAGERNSTCAAFSFDFLLLDLLICFSSTNSAFSCFGK